MHDTLRKTWLTFQKRKNWTSSGTHPLSSSCFLCPVTNVSTKLLIAAGGLLHFLHCISSRTPHLSPSPPQLRFTLSSLLTANHNNEIVVLVSGFVREKVLNWNVPMLILLSPRFVKILEKFSILPRSCVRFETDRCMEIL